MITMTISKEQQKILSFLRMYGPSYYKELAAKCSPKECAAIPGLKSRGMLTHSYTVDGRVVYKITCLGCNALDAAEMSK